MVWPKEKKKVIVSDSSVLSLQHFLDSHSLTVSALTLNLKNIKNKSHKTNPAFVDKNRRNEWGQTISREQNELAAILRAINPDSETNIK